MSIHLILHQFFIQSNLNFSICVCSMILSVIAILLIQINKAIDLRGSIYLTTLGILNFLFGTSYLVELFLTGHSEYLLTNIMWWDVSLEYVLPYLISHVMTEYLIHRVEDKDGRIRIKWPLRIVYILIFAVTFHMIGTGRYYGVDVMGYYYRSDLYIVSQSIGMLLVLMNLAVLLLTNSNLTRKEKNALVAYFLAPVCSVLIQLTGTHLYVMVAAMTLSMLMIAVYLQHIQAKLFYSREKDLAELKMVLLLSQLRPHFLYNALSSISQLCKIKPEQASEMTDRFAEFLRKNMRDIQNNEPVLFETELEHIKNYIAIEQMRYNDLVKTEYDIQVKDFEVPSFVLQPLVENAIRHGLYRKEEGGTIRISTRTSGKMVILTIADDGVGFDTKKSRDKEPHLGIDSVRKRVETIPHANFMLSSVPGMGTTAVILLPHSITSAQLATAVEETDAQPVLMPASEPEVPTPAGKPVENIQIRSLADARKEMEEREAQLKVPEVEPQAVAEFSDASEILKKNAVQTGVDKSVDAKAENLVQTQEEKVKTELSALEALLSQKNVV